MVGKATIFKCAGVKCVCVGMAVLLAASASGRMARGGTGLLVGVDDDTLKWTEDTPTAVAAHKALGLTAVRVTLQWQPGQTRLDDDGRTYMRRAQAAARLGDRVVVAIFGDPSNPPTTQPMQDAFCSFAVDALSRAKNVRDVVIWNEVNSALFWRPQQGSAIAYEALLADCYDVLHKYRRTVNVISSTAPHENPAAFIQALGVAYRASGRTLPIFDTFGHDAYPEVSSESPLALHPAPSLSLDQGDYVRLLLALTQAFEGTGQPVPGSGNVPSGGNTPTAPTTNGPGSQQVQTPGGPVTIWYLEDGFETVVTYGKRTVYTGRESNRQLIQPIALRATTASQARDQTVQLHDALELGYCQPAVGAFFNFQLSDEIGLGGWQSGLLWADGTPKPSYEPFKANIAAVVAGTVDCSRFPVSITGPQTAPVGTTTTTVTATTTTTTTTTTTK